MTRTYAIHIRQEFAQVIADTGEDMMQERWRVREVVTRGNHVSARTIGLHEAYEYAHARAERAVADIAARRVLDPTSISIVRLLSKQWARVPSGFELRSPPPQRSSYNH